MANRIPESFIAEVRQKVNIVDVIGQYTQLVKRGRQWTGSCPFHDDRHPSLFVEENKQVFNCFSCGRSGSVFSFVMEKEGMSYPEAIISLAESVDMQVDSQFVADATPRIDPKTQAIFDLQAAAQRLYQHILQHTTSGETALHYLHDKRQLTDETIKQFGIGFVPDDNVLLQYAETQNISREIMLASDLFLSNDEGRLRDRFAGRVVWPIRSMNGQVVGFSGRTLDSKNSIKYMNSPESPFFNKGQILYNFDLAKGDIRKTGTAMIFEGFMDVISSEIAGRPAAVATMGTALTQDHVRQLTRLAKRILLVYDGDEAGQNAAKRSIHLIQAQKQDVDIGIVHLPDDLDPDEVRVQKGKEVLKQALDQNIQTPIAFLIQAARYNKNLSNQTQYLAFLGEVMTILQQATPVEQDMQLTRIANEFGTSKQALIEQLKQTPKRQSKETVNRTSQHFHQQSPQITDMEEPPLTGDEAAFSSNQQSTNQIEQAERALIMAMIKSPQVLEQVSDTTGFAFVHPEYQLLMMLIAIYQKQQAHFDLAQFMDFIQKPELNQRILAIDRTFGDLAVEPGAISDYLRIIMHDAPVEAQIKTLQQAIDVAKQQHDDNKLLQLTTELINIKKQRNK